MLTFPICKYIGFKSVSICVVLYFTPTNSQRQNTIDLYFRNNGFVVQELSHHNGYKKECWVVSYNRLFSHIIRTVISNHEHVQ